MRALVLLVAAGSVFGSALGQTPFRESLAQMKIEQKLGAQVPAEARFKDEYGKDIKFASLLGRRPIILLPMFFLCRGICGKEADNLLKAVARLENIQVGRDHDVVLLSIHPKETPELALSKKESLLKVMKGETNREGYHFLTGKMEEIRKVTNAVGFGFDYDEKDGRINHPAGLMILTASGKVSQYIMGSEYPRHVVAQAISVASDDRVGDKVATVLLGCVMIDPVTGQKSLVIENVIRLIAGIFALSVFSWIAIMTIKTRRSASSGGATTGA